MGNGVPGVPGPAPARITNNVGEFSEWLLPGDVLLFDTIHPLSGAIQFAESRPINHCALYLSDDRIAQVTRQDPAAWTLRLSDRLNTPFDRTVTALRHEASGPQGLSEVVTRANEYIDPQDTSYAYLSLLALSVPGIFRSYGLYLDEGGGAGHSLAALMETLSNALIATFEPDAGGADQDPVKRKLTLTCSEFIFRSYLEATPSRPIMIQDPLFCLANKPAGAANGRRGAAFDAVDRGAEADDFGLKMHPSLAAACALSDAAPDMDWRDADREWDQYEAFWNFMQGDRDRGDGEVIDEVTVTAGVPAPALPDDFRALDFFAADRGLGGWSTVKTLARAGLSTVYNLVAHNGDLKKYGTFRPGPGIDPYRVLADTVTPKDLWSSPSLNVVAVLHRPPNHESGLDEVHH